MSGVARASERMFTSGDIAMVANAVLSAAHGLGVRPKRFTAVWVMQAAVNGYAVGDEVEITSGWFTSAPAPYGCASSDATNIYAAIGATNPTIWDRSTGAQASPGIGNFKVRFRAWA